MSLQSRKKNKLGNPHKLPFRDETVPMQYMSAKIRLYIQPYKTQEDLV